ncbi:MAG: MarR family transcriptional regulator [Thermomicrobiales bacterium]|nr:MarR family transcriptional regulator [Thermomicrobiales bacterium]
MPRGAELPSGLRDQTGYWLNRLRGLAHARLEAALAEHGLTAAQWSVLITVYREDAVTPLEIARFIDVDPGSLTRLLDRMEDKDLVRRLPVDGDRRSIRIALAPHAAALAPHLAALADANDAQLFASLSEPEARAFRRTLGKVLRAQGVEPPSGWDEDERPE